MSVQPLPVNPSLEVLATTPLTRAQGNVLKYYLAVGMGPEEAIEEIFRQDPPMPELSGQYPTHREVFDAPEPWIAFLAHRRRAAAIDRLDTYRENRRRRSRGYLVPPTDARNRNGWFKDGNPSVVFGSSGSGKTTFVLELLKCGLLGRDFLGRRIVPLRPPDILWVHMDRELDALWDSLEDAGLTREQIPHVKAGADFPRHIAERQPEVVVLDGLDIHVADLRGQSLKALFADLQKMAATQKVVLLVLWGTPKRQATKDSYSETRVSATGSADVGRMSETNVLVTRVKDMKGCRKVTVSARRVADDEEFIVAWSPEDGFQPADTMEVNRQKDPIEVLRQAGLSFADIKKSPLGKLISESTWHRRKKP